MTDFKYNFGDKVRCELKDYEGIIYAKTEYATGCKQYGIQVEVDKDRDNDKCLCYDDEGLLILLVESKLQRVPKQVERFDFK